MTRTYLQILNQNRPLLRIYIEASQVQALRQAFFDILNQVFMDIVQNSRSSFEEESLYLSTLASASAEIELLSQFEQGKLSMEKIFSTVVKVKLSLLGIGPKAIEEVLKSSYQYQVMAGRTFYNIWINHFLCRV